MPDHTEWYRLSIMDRKFKPVFNEITTSPGVYQFISSSGAVLYIGKAKSLRSRVKSYYAKDHGRGPRIDLMLEAARDIKIIETDSEIEALLLEAELIKKIKPKFNVSLKDDKSFLILEFSKDQFPRLDLIRSKEKELLGKSMRYSYGPYPSGDLLKSSLKYLRKLFPYRDCSESKYKIYAKRGRTCLYGDLKLCLGPCANEVSESDYKDQLSYLKQFLKGKKARILISLNKEMARFAKKQRYEEAAVIRNKIYALEHLREVAIGIKDDTFSSTKIIFNRIECYDISNIMGQYAVGSMSVMERGEKNKSQYRKFKIKYVSGANDVAMIKEVLIRRFRNDWPSPDLLVIDGGQPQLNAAVETLKRLRINIPIVSIAKGAKRDKNEFRYSNPDMARYIKATPEAQKAIIVARDEAHRFAIKYYRKLHSKGMIES